MNVGSLFSGIGGMDEGLRRAGWEHAFFCEGGGDPNGTREEREQWKQGKWRRQVLRERFPGVPIYDDVVRVAMGTDAAGASSGHQGRIGLLCGGFPCQDLSVAGRRKGLAGERSSLFFEFARIADALRPGLLLVENVPGLLSSNGGRDFGVVLGTLADIGYGVGWRILDSRFFGVPQRRRRVFIVGMLAHGDPARAAERAGEILAVGQGCDRHLASRGETGADVAGTLGGGAGDRGWAQDTERMTFVPSPTVRSHPRPGSNSDGLMVAAPLSHGSNPNSNMAGRRREDDENLVSFDAEYSNQAALGDNQAVLTRKLRRAVSSPAQGVRRLTPIECERLQALPDDWTRVPDTAPDSRRYAALGDAVTASVAEWIGRRLLEAASVSREAVSPLKEME